MTTNDVSDTTLWCINITGPDDVLAVASRSEAVFLSARFNAVMAETFEPKAHPHDPMMWAVPTQWPHDAKSHAANLGDLGEYAWLRHPQPVNEPGEWQVEREPAEERMKAAIGRYETVDELAAGMRASASYFRQQEPCGSVPQPIVTAEFHDRVAIALERAALRAASIPKVEPGVKVVPTEYLALASVARTILAKLESETASVTILDQEALECALKMLPPSPSTIEGYWSDDKTYEAAPQPTPVAPVPVTITGTPDALLTKALAIAVKEQYGGSLEMAEAVIWDALTAALSAKPTGEE